MWGGQGLDPRHLLSPFTTLRQAQGSPTCTRLHRGPWVLEKMSPEAAGPQAVVGQALVDRRAGSHSTSSQGLLPRSPCRWVDPRGRPLRRRLGPMF